jgi:CBS domain-containing protein
MSTDVQLITPDRTIREAAQRMIEIDAGVLPVAENDRRPRHRRARGRSGQVAR